MGSIPDWYLTIRAAKYLGVPPWDLMDKSRIWMMWALHAEAAEARAEKALMERAKRKTA